jgi:hypothetical protein
LRQLGPGNPEQVLGRELQAGHRISAADSHLLALGDPSIKEDRDVIREAQRCNRTQDKTRHLLNLLCSGKPEPTPALTQVRARGMRVEPRIPCDTGHHVLSFVIPKQDGFHHFLLHYAALPGCSIHREYRLVMREQPVADAVRIEGTDHFRVRRDHLRIA